MLLLVVLLLLLPLCYCCCCLTVTILTESMTIISVISTPFDYNEVGICASCCCCYCRKYKEVTTCSIIGRRIWKYRISSICSVIHPRSILKILLPLTFGTSTTVAKKKVFKHNPPIYRKKMMYLYSLL